MRLAFALMPVLLMTACKSMEAPAPRAAEVSPPQAGPATAMREIFPHVRINLEQRQLEFDSTLSPLLTPDPRAPYFFLESVACLPDTREHESLVVSLARPSHIHAGLLALGLQPGAPGGWRFIDNRLIPFDARGDSLTLRFVYNDPATNQERAVDPLDWIVNIAGNRPFREAASPAARWVFAGSRIIPAPRSRLEAAANPNARVPEVYDADGSGTVIGLTTFSSETIAWSNTISPDAGTQEPEWIARMEALPPAGTAIRVQISPLR